MKRGRATGITVRKSIWPYIAHGTPGGQCFPGVFLEWAGPDDLKYGIYRLLNRMAAQGEECGGIQALLLFPAEAEEAELRGMMQAISAECGKAGVSLRNAEAIVQSAVSRPSAVLMGQGRGVSGKGCPQAGMQLLQIGPAACEGTLRLLEKHRAALEKRFCPEFLEGAAAMASCLDLRGAAAWLREQGVSGMYAVSEGGIFAGLWEASENWKLGFEADLKRILIRQETVEICEFLGKNPYCLAGSGCILACAESGETLAEGLKERGYSAAVIGTFKKEKARVLRSGEERRYLDLPAEDEIYQEER